MKKLRMFCIFTSLLANQLPLAFAQTSENQRPTQQPKCFFQILNGISSGPIDIYFDGHLVYPSTVMGQRLSSLGWPKEKFDFRVVDKKSNREKRQKIEFPEGSYGILILAGDFEILPDQESVKPGEPPAVRVVIQVLPNKLGTDEAAVRVRFMNSLVDRPVTVKAPDGKSWIVPPLSLTVATSLPEELYLQAFLNNKSRSLYLAQPPPAKNISVVFYPSKDALGFRAMTESTPEAIQSDIKRAQQQEADEKAEAEKKH